MNKKMLSASLGALLLGIQIGSPTLGDVQPDENLLNDLRLLDCRLLAGDRDGIKRLLDENGELLRLIKGRLPECLPEAEAEEHASLHDFSEHLEGRGENHQGNLGDGGPQGDAGFGGGRADGGGDGDDWDDDDDDDDDDHDDDDDDDDDDHQY